MRRAYLTLLKKGKQSHEVSPVIALPRTGVPGTSVPGTSVPVVPAGGAAV